MKFIEYSIAKFLFFCLFFLLSEGILTSDSGERTSMADVAPSLRLMVMNGDLKGSLHIVTLDGGTMGREGDVQVLLKDASVSKVSTIGVNFRHL